ncbi:hypothetical protein ADICYQ_5492 [Cyclobacterium qasimii M12-11B]|nr:hypothetical protein ADICYQ_5492 [Cyclobacterium qasimii M12-11B]
MEVKLTADMVNHLNEITLPLKEKLGSNADLWQTGGRVI